MEAQKTRNSQSNPGLGGLVEAMLEVTQFHTSNNTTES
jgi:hypothetical protein